MLSSTNYTPHDVTADINYFPATGEVIPTSTWKTRYLGIGDEHTRSITIHDLRGVTQNYSLDKNGFRFVKLPQKERDISSDETIVREYYSELENLIKKMTGASTVHVFNHVTRQHSSPSDKGKLDEKGRWQAIPSGHPHVDYCGVPELMEGTKQEITLPPHISALYATSSRFCFLGAWRPLKTLVKDPLAVADATTVPNSDYQLRAREFRSGIKAGNYVMSHGSEKDMHKWYYMHEMQPDELVVFKGYDTKQDLPGWRCPHTAFVIPGTENLPPRESIEARIICFWD